MPKQKNPAAVDLGRMGGKKRASSRGWEKIPAEKRSELAKKAVLVRWAKARTVVKANKNPAKKAAKARKQ